MINNVVIVGGGSAGWMTAATIAKYYPEKNITVIESPNIPTVGVGESTLGVIRDWIRALEINEDDFMKFTDASYKMSIKFVNFYSLEDQGFHYPFGPPFTQHSEKENFNGQEVLKLWHIKKSKDKNLKCDDYTKTFWPSMALIENNKFSLNKNNEFSNYHPKVSLAYHFDAIKFATWLREKYSIPRGVKHVKSEVKEVVLNEDGVDYLILDNGDKVSADLFVDCTGFKSMILGEALKEPFNTYHDILPNNRAWAVQVPYTDKEKELEPYTKCTAIENGWVWNIPLWSRIGTGYVYSDKYISPEAALDQFKSYLNSEKMSVYNTNRVTDDLQFRDIKMRIGRHERMFVKNVVAIGLSAGFIEPLESNGLLSVHRFLFFLVDALSRGSVSQWDRDVYNLTCNTLFDHFAEFVALHYALSHRTDTEYWKDTQKRQYKIDNTKVDSAFFELAQVRVFNKNQNGHRLLHSIAVGMNYWNYTADTVLPNGYGIPTIHEENLDSFNEKVAELRLKWESEAEKCPTLYQYLKDKYSESI